MLSPVSPSYAASTSAPGVVARRLSRLVPSAAADDPGQVPSASSASANTPASSAYDAPGPVIDAIARSRAWSCDIRE